MDHGGDPGHVQCSDEEVAYMCDAVNRWLDPGIRSTDVTWRYAGGRPLLDDGAGAAAAVTRDYRLDLDTVDGHGGLLTKKFSLRKPCDGSASMFIRPVLWRET